MERLLATAVDDMTMWRNLLALLPYTVPVDHEHRRALLIRPRQEGHL